MSTASVTGPDALRLVFPDNMDDAEEMRRLVTRLFDQLLQKEPKNKQRLAYYEGERHLAKLGLSIPPQYGGLRIALGWSGKAVDILARRCNLEYFAWPDGDLGELGAHKLFAANHLQTKINAAIVSSLIYGVAFLITTKGSGDGEPGAVIHVKDALSATGDWNDRKSRLDNLLSVTSVDKDGKPTGLVLYKENRTLTFSGGSGGDLALTSDQEHSLGMPAEALVYRYRTDKPFGSSRLSRTVMALHDQAVRASVRLEAHSDIYSFPDMWLLGADLKSAFGEGADKFTVMMGRMKGIADDEDATNPRVDVKQFQAASPQPHLDMFRQLAQTFSGETHIPLTSLGVSDMSNPTSADSYIASREDLIAEAEGAADDWGPAIARTFSKALRIVNDGEIDGIETLRPRWRNPIYLSRAAAADAGMKQLAAVPWLADTKVGLELLGLSDAQIDAALSERRTANAQRVLDSIVSQDATEGA